MVYCMVMLMYISYGIIDISHGVVNVEKVVENWVNCGNCGKTMYCVLFC